MNDKLLAELAQHFRANTLERLDAMRTLVARLDGERGDHETLSAIHRHFHGLAGLGGTYGFPHVSEVAADAEEACESIDASSTPDDAFIAMLERANGAIQDEIKT